MIHKKGCKGEKNPFYGRKHTNETKKHLSECMKQLWKINPNRGLKGKHHTEENKKKLSAILKKLHEDGKIKIWCEGKHFSEEHRKKLSEIRKQLYREGKSILTSKRPEVRLKMSRAKKGRCFSEEHKKKLSEAKKLNPVKYWLGKKLTKETIKKQVITKKRLYEEGKIVPYWLGKKRDKKTNDKISYTHKKMLKENPEFLKKILTFIRPNKQEKMLINLIEQNNLPFKYVGNGEFILGGKCPDFLNNNGQKKVIEFFGKAFHAPNFGVHKNKKIPYYRTYEGTIEHYKKYGFDCLIIWNYELKELNKVVEKINNFIGEANGK